jgi:Pregnancy-associated plasma protein-A/SprB repeat/Secretion system C-terminal sorting domain
MNMVFTKQHPFLFFFLFLATQLLSQTPVTPFVTPDVEHHDPPRKCGHTEATEALLANHPELEEQFRNFKRDIPAMVEAYRNSLDRSSLLPPIINIPVVVHVIHTGQPVGTGMNIPDAQIFAQMDILNDDFSALNANFPLTPAQWQPAIGNPEINFCLAAIDPNGNPTNGITRHNMTVTGSNTSNSNIESVIKPATWWDSDLYYNIWVLPIPGTTAAGGTTGYAYYPFNGTIGTSSDGSVVDYRWFGGPGFPQSGDKTLTHETGHYLGLPHTFDGDNCGSDDGFTDTPNMSAATSSIVPNLNCSPSSFPTGPTTCTAEHMYVNYMDYVNDEYCYTSFSNQQIALMRAVLNGQSNAFGYGSRLPLANNAVAVCTFYDNDAAVTKILNPGTFVCQTGQITPVVEITNFGQNNLQTVTINYKINNNTPVSLVWATNLATAERDTVTLAPYTPPGGAYVFTAYTTLPNGVADEQPVNDTTDIQTLALTPLPLPLLENFENPAFNPTVNGLFVFDITNDGVSWVRSTAASGFGVGTASAMFDNYNNGGIPLGTIDALITPIYDFSSVTDGKVTFDVAYAYYQNGAQVLSDTLIVLISTNCGTNYTQQIYVKGGAVLSTAPPTAAQFTPTPTQWRTETIDLSAFDGEDNVSIMFVNYYGYGNRLFIDNINISQPCALTVSESHTNIDCFDDCTGSAIVNPSGGTGAYTYQWSANANNATTQSVNNLCAGTYTVTVSNGPTCTAVATVVIMENSQLNTTVSGTNPTAVGLNNGTATANPTGGDNSIYTYAWSNGAITQTITGLAPNTYTVTVTDGAGCTVVGSIVITPFDCGAYGIMVTGTNVNCFGNNNGTATATVNAGTGTAPFTYNWSNSAGNVPTITGLGPNVYSVTVTDANGCTATGSYTVTQPTALTVNVSATDETAPDANNGTVTAVPAGGTNPTTFAWSNGGNTGMIINLAPGVYTVTVTDANGCTAIASGTVNEAPVDCSSFNIAVQSSMNVSCNGGPCNGNINLTVNGGATPLTFDWNNNTLDGQQNPSNLCEGTYSVTVTDNNGCSASLIHTITQPDNALTVDWLASNINCFGQCTGSIQANGQGGTGPYSVNISGGSFTNLCAGNYNITVTDAQGCTATALVPVTEFGPDQISATVTDAVCFGQCNGSISISATNNGPYTFSWSNGGNSASQNNLCAGAYNITVTNAQACSTVINETVGSPTALTVNVATTPISAPGANDATATATPSGGSPNYGYLWQPNGETTASIGPLAPGLYTVVVTDAAGCTVQQNVVINPFDCVGFSANISGTTGQTCADICDGTISTSVTGGAAPITYSWSDATLNGQSAPTGLCAGSYTVTISEGNGCSVILNTTVTTPAPLVVSISGTNPSSPGANDGTASASASGGSTPYTYLWSPNGETTPNISNLGPGTYTVVVTDDNDCTATETFVIQAIDCSTFSLGLSIVDVLCFGQNTGMATATLSGGSTPYTYLWSTNASTSSITNLSAGNYSITVSDNAGCTIVQNFAVTQAPIMGISISSTNETTAGANDGTATVNVSGGTPGYTYLWCNGSTTNTAINLPPGQCAVTIIDNNGCIATVSVIIGAGTVDCSNFAATLTPTAVTCFNGQNGSVSAVTTGGTGMISYLWSNNANTSTISNVPSGNYSVTITSGNGCQLISSAFVGTPTAIVLNTTSTNETTAGANDGTATVTASGGTPGYTYLWCNGATTNGAQNLPPGVCSVTVTDNNGCMSVATVIINAGGVDCSDFSATLTPTAVTCFNGQNGSVSAVTTGGTGTISYGWSNNATTSTINNVPSGNYTVTITSGNGCQLIESAFVGTPTAIVLNTTSTDETTAGANDGIATVTVSGGTSGYTYLWCNSATTSSVMNLPPGVCSVTVTDNNGCMAMATVIIDAGGVDCTGFAATLTPTAVTCFGASNGSVNSVVSGGSAPVNYLWSTGATTTSINNLSPGSYSVTITDGNACQLIKTVLVSSPTAIVVNTSSTNETIAGANDGTALATSTGGTPGYTYLWCNGATTANVMNLSPGSCSVTVTDNNGCTAVATVVIGAGSADCSNFGVAVVPVMASCFGEADGSAMAVVTGGTPPYTYLWSTSAITASINNLVAGNYFVTVLDANNCQAVDNGIVGQPSAINYNITSTAESAPGANDGTAIVSVTGGIAPYNLQWCNGQNTVTATNLSGGDCGLTITDAIGCTVVTTVFIETIPLDCSTLEMSYTASGLSCFEDTDGSIALQITGGAQPYVINWSNGGNTALLNNLTAGPYSVTVTDDIGCQLIQQNIIVTQPLPIQILTIGYDGNCGGTAAALATGSGGTAPYSYNWSNGMSTMFIEDLSSGIYTVTVTDSQGCQGEAFVQVQVTSILLDLSYDVNAVSCFGESDGAIDITMTSGTPPFTFQWTNGSTTEDLFDMSSGTYSVLVTDAAGCLLGSTFDIGSPAPLTVNFATSPADNGNNGSVTALASGGTGPYTYNWNGPQTATINNLTVGTYSVTITDSNGCTVSGSVFLGTSSTADIENLLSINLYPNPTDGAFVIEAVFSNHEEVEVMVYNVLGQMLTYQKVSGLELMVPVDIRLQPVGTYLVLLKTRDGAVVRKVVKN